MKKFLFTAGFTVLSSLSSAVYGGDLETLSGKWSLNRVNDQGQKVTQNVEVKKDKFTFEVLADDALVLHAEGDIKLEKLGAFKAARFYKVRAGQSSTSLDDVDDEFVSIYRLEDDTFTLASNMDKDRDQKPSLDIYHRVKAALQTSTLVIDEIEMADNPQDATWYICFDAKVQDAKARHYVQDKGYEKKQLTIPLALELKAQAGQKCTFRMQLDDVDEDACTEEVDNRSTGEFTVTERGSQTYKPEEHWRYTIRWHLK